MALTMSQRKAVTNETVARYRKATKSEKGRILTEFVKTTQYSRKYATWVLRNWGRRIWLRIQGELVQVVVGCPCGTRKRSGRPRIYDALVQAVLKRIWYIFDCPCGKRLVVLLRSMLPVLEKFSELTLEGPTRKKLLVVSAATVDRLLSQEKKKLRLKGRSYTRSSIQLKHQIPIRTFDAWKRAKAGSVMVDLVGHDGGSSRGDFAFTLDLTDVKTGWTEPWAIQNKAQKWTFEALVAVGQQLPFPLRSLHSDNGSEFLNAHLIRYTKAHHLRYTRGRPYRKNDTCFVEQKNSSIVRRYAGYLRYDSSEEVQLLNRLYQEVRLFVNFFQPSMKLISKTRVGSRVRKRYDLPKTPFQRLLGCAEVSRSLKRHLHMQFNSLNPVELHRRINRLQTELFRLAKEKQSQPMKAVG